MYSTWLTFQVTTALELDHIMDRDINLLSGGELQRFAIAITCVQDAQVYMFDEPSSFLDVKQRMKAALCIRSLLSPNKYVIVIDHDLSVLDFELPRFQGPVHANVSRYVRLHLPSLRKVRYSIRPCTIRLLGYRPAAYGVVTMPHSVR